MSSFSVDKEYVEAVLLLRNTAEFQRFTRAVRLYRDHMLMSCMTAPQEHADRLRYGAGAVSEVLQSIESIEDLRQQYETDGQAETSTPGI